MAERLEISRTAVSHLEAGMSVPSERTVVLLAGLFRVEPRDLVAGTKYPGAKAERLPAVAARYTELELMAELLDGDLGWLEGADAAQVRLTLDSWETRLLAVDEHAVDERQRGLLAELRRRVRARRSSPS
jgi:transcriptional regulator with XRE-family HTH domain